MAKYIDADKLLAEAKRLSGPQTGDGWDNWGVYALIERQPAADVRENVSGNWIIHHDQKNVYGGTMIECAACHTKYLVQHLQEEIYCRNCGADMRGENNV